MNSSEVQLELLREIRQHVELARKLKEEVRAATQGGGFTAVATPASVKSTMT